MPEGEQNRILSIPCTSPSNTTPTPVLRGSLNNYNNDVWKKEHIKHKSLSRLSTGIDRKGQKRTGKGGKGQDRKGKERAGKDRTGQERKELE